MKSTAESMFNDKNSTFWRQFNKARRQDRIDHEEFRKNFKKVLSEHKFEPPIKRCSKPYYAIRINVGRMVLMGMMTTITAKDFR